LIAVLIGLTMISALATDYLTTLFPVTHRPVRAMSIEQATPYETKSLTGKNHTSHTLSSLRRELFYCGYAMGWLCFTAAWSVIACYFCFSASHGSPPVFVWVIMGVILILDVSFAYVYHRQNQCNHDDTCILNHKEWIMQHELYFACLSMISKQSLAWILYFGSRAIE
jgi:hypothetical protein